jgi:heat shock protein HtpX
MTQYTQISSNLYKTWLLLTIFLIFIIDLGWLFSYYFNSREILFFAIFFSILTSFLSYWYSDKIVLSLTRAKEIKKEEAPELYRLVKNLCLTAGLPLPKIYILDELAPNAFATGRNPEHAVIAVTRGLLEKLEKSELEGVLAHEIAHIGNRDTLLQTIVVILIGFVTLICDFFFRLAFYNRNRFRDKNNQINSIFFLFGIIATIIAPLLAKLLGLAISRRREFLADATGVLITRYPEGLIRALKKISYDQTPLKIANNATAHLYIVNPFRGQQSVSWLTKLFMTHPPIEDRIKALRQVTIE